MPKGQERNFTRLINVAVDGINGQFADLITQDMLLRKLDDVRYSLRHTKDSAAVAAFYALMDASNIKYKSNGSYEYYRHIIESSDLPDASDIDDIFIKTVFELFKKNVYKTPEEYLERIVDSCCDPADGWNNDTLRIRILKQFIKYGDYLKDAGLKMKTKTEKNGLTRTYNEGYGGRAHIQKYVKEKIKLRDGKLPKTVDDELILAELDDGVFDVLETAKSEEKKPGGKFGLLKMIDDLAGGKFRVEGAPKRGLYLFAIVYNMKYSADDLTRFDVARDIETNLFTDYYANNMMRFITDAYKGRLSEYDPDPSGQGINYRNFAEIVYLYFLSREDLTPQEKIKYAGEMILRLSNRESADSLSVDITSKKRHGTVFYRDNIKTKKFSDSILSLPQEEFEEFVCNKFNRSIGNASVFQAETEQKTAFCEYSKIIYNLIKSTDDEGKPIKLEECNYGIYFMDAAAFNKLGLEDLYEQLQIEEEDKETFEKFSELIFAVNRFLGFMPNETVSDRTFEAEHKELSRYYVPALDIKEASNVTRTSMITAYYYYFNAHYTPDDYPELTTFNGTFRKFKAGITPYLRNSFYQELSGKNIFDLLIVYSAFSRLNQ